MDSIHERFNIAINYLFKHAIVKTQKEIAIAVGLDPNNFREIIKKRGRLRTELVETFLNKYPVNPLYLIGKSNEVMLNEPLGEVNHTGSSLVDKADMTEVSVNNSDVIRLTRALKAESISDAERFSIANELQDLFALLQDENSRANSKLVSFIEEGRK